MKLTTEQAREILRTYTQPLTKAQLELYKEALRIASTRPLRPL